MPQAGRRGTGEEVGARLRLRVGDHLADVLLPGKDRHQAIDAEGEAGMRWCPVAERVEQEAEPALRLLGADPERVEDPRLDVPSVDSDAARSQLPPVEDEVVGLRTHGEGDGVEERQVLLVRHGERVMGRLRVPAASTPSNMGKSTTHT